MNLFDFAKIPCKLVKAKQTCPPNFLAEIYPPLEDPVSAGLREASCG